MKIVSVSLCIIAAIYVVIGVVPFLMLDKTEEGVKGNILSSLPEGHIFNIIIAVLMTVSCMGSYPLFMRTVHEIVEGDWGAMTSNRFFITNKRYVIFRVIELLLISVVAALIPFFSDLLGFNILALSSG